MPSLLLGVIVYDIDITTSPLRYYTDHAPMVTPPSTQITCPVM
jgi:hypothetical protein